MPESSHLCLNWAAHLAVSSLEAPVNGIMWLSLQFHRAEIKTNLFSVLLRDKHKDMHPHQGRSS